MLRTARKVSSHGNIAAMAAQSSQPNNTGMRRRRKETECLLKLERVLGLTSNKPMILSVNSTHDLVAYAAGCVVVLYNHKIDKQIGLLCSSTLKKPPSVDSGLGTLSGMGGGSGPRGLPSFGGSPRMAPMSTSNSNQWMSSAFASPNINPLAGLMPMGISDASIASGFGTSNQIGEIQGHKFGVQAVQFSPNSKYLVSLGFQHDGYIHVWNWKTGLQIASNKVTTKVNALAFSADGTFFVTAGLRHIKFWYLNVGSNKRGGLSGNASSTQVLDGRSGILGDLRDGNYVDAVCSADGRFTYAITSNGTLCLFTEGRVMEKWINLHTRGTYSVNLDERHIICACTDGIIRLFEPETLQYVGTLPKPSPVGASLGEKNKDHGIEDTSNSVFPDVLASQYDASSGCLICIYSDRSLYVWNIEDPHSAFISRTHMSHSDCVWGAEIIPAPNDDMVDHSLSPDTFITYSADGSIIFWNLDENISLLPPISSPKDNDSNSPEAKGEIVNILYVDKNCKSWIQLPENQDGMEPGFNTVPVECGIRTVKVSPDGKLLASGDKGGNLRVHELSSLEQVTYQEAHETEIMAIDFTDPRSKDSPFLVATAGRDRLLHVFDVVNDYALVQTLDDHSSSITCIKFTSDGSRMMSCGADKSLIFRNRQKNTEGFSYQPYHQAPGRATFYEMGLNDESQTISVVSADRRFNIFTLDSGKSIKSFKAETKGDDLAAGMAEICSMNHISLDPTGTIAAASGSDKSVRIYDLLHGTCLAHMICHSELVTSVKFMNGFDRIVSTSADGCVMIWRLSKDIVRRIHARIQENVTLPAYLQAKATEKVMGTTQSPRPLRLMRSADKPGIYSNEYCGASRRNSAVSVMSDDCDLRSEDDGNEQRKGIIPRVPRIEDVSKESFAPVTVNLTGSPARSRDARSISKTPLTRSRQNSTSQHATARSRSSTRSNVLPELPPWNRNILKEKAKSPPSSTKLPEPVPPRQLTSKSTAKIGRFAPNNPRQRATSLAVPTEATLKLDNQKLQSHPCERQSLSDYARDDPPNAPGDDDDGMLSDDTESGFEDGLGFGSQSPSQSEIDKIEGDATPTPERIQNSKDSTLSLLRDNVRSLTQDIHLKSELLESGEAVSETEPVEETGASEGRDSDDEQADEDESISETGSDIEPISPLRRINTGHSIPRHDSLGSPNSVGSGGEIYGGFGDGERLGDSPVSERGQQVISPSGRVISLRPVGAGRRSLSSMFLTAHAASIMMGMAQKTFQGREPDDSQGVSSHTQSSTPENFSQNLSAVDTATRLIVDGQPRQTTSTISAKNELLVTDIQDQPLEERLNLQSLNAAALRWKQRTLGSGSAPNNQRGDSEAERKYMITQNGEKQAAAKSDEYFKEVERTRERLAELGYFNTPSSDQKAGSTEISSSTEISNSTEASNSTEKASKAPTVFQENLPVISSMKLDIPHERPIIPPERIQIHQLEGILASPVDVKSPEGVVLGFESRNRSLKHAFDMQDNGGPEDSISTGEGSSKYGLEAREIRQDYSSEQSLRDAFERISFLISHKAMTATHLGDRRFEAQDNDGANESNAVQAADSERVKETKKWMLETREGLLNLVGEVQGHLWALDRINRRDQE
ncbi:mitogen-activated protein kinase binding protein 1 [Entomortierella chlamydospora]|uniref:Mitogen-activated protein kinase binding protein 1 n=1 Tax=Entomortierella chlamydospora TaxID=101097 RepID=A0A9P6MTB2_9FUNG|nr:mitogen-activated protein kinase binding protein 1 [Entomortierella chlamydospora]